MIDHVWTVICSRSSIDSETKNVSLFNVIEQVNVLGPLPDPAEKAAAPIAFEAVTLWTRSNLAEAEESRGRLKLISPNGTEALTQEFAVNLTEHVRLRTQLRSMGFPLLGAGRYIFTIEIQRANNTWETVARVPVQLDSIAQAAPEANAPGH